MKLVRRATGQRIIFETTNHFVIDEIEKLSEDCIRIQSKSPISHYVTNVTNTYLYNLVLINVFDNRSEFITADGVDFAYCLMDYASSILTLAEWIGTEKMPVRARWESKRSDLQNVLSSVGYKDKALFRKERGRESCLDFDTDMEN